MENNVIEFLRSFILADNDSDTLRNLKSQALDLMLVAGGTTSRVTIQYPGWNPDEPKKFATISRETYNKASAFLRAGQKINAIKEIRTETKLGLKESKEATDIWDFSL
jgi:hypothetical protein